MTKKEISTYLRKWFKYSPSAREIVFFELYNIPKKESEFTREDREATFKELQRQFPDQYKEKPKRPKNIVVYIPNPKHIPSMERVYEARRQDSNDLSWRIGRKRALECKEWHTQNKRMIPEEMQQIFKKYDIQ